MTALKIMKERHAKIKRIKDSIAGNVEPYKLDSTNIVFTIGYEKRNIKNFIKVLKINKIKLLVDIRANGFSHKRDFSNSIFVKNLKEAGIDYLAIRELGSPKELREGLKKYGYKWFFDKYRDYIKGKMDEIDKLEKIISKRRSCLMCFELYPEHCHRSIVSEKLQERGYEVVHL